jgi:type VI secretion system Hcp family effector
MVIKIGDILGESAKSETPDWIEVSRLEHSISQDITEADMANKDRAGFARFSFLSISKKVDVGTPDIQAHCASGKKIPKVELKVYQSSTDNTPLLVYTLENCFIALTNLYGSDTAVPMEDVSLAYSKISLKCNALKSGGGSMTKGWDLAEQKEV